MRSMLVLVLFFFMQNGSAGPLQVEGARFVTKDGRQVLLRGVNVGGDAKVPPFRSIRSEKDFAPLPGWGFNSLRLLFNWEAFEAEPGVYDRDYLSYYRQLVDWAAQHDLYVLVDIHQDVFSRFAVSGCGEGFPQWALPPFQIPATPDNGENCKDWPLKAILDSGMHVAWHHFYRNTYGVRDRYLLMLRELALALADAPNLIGFDLLNEPWGSEKTEIAALYTDAGRVVRAVLPDTILFLGAQALAASGIIPSRLDRIDLPNIVHAAHFYDPGLQTVKSWSAWTLKTANGHWKELIERWQSPLYLGEFGAPASLPNAVNYVDAIYDLMDQELYSGAYWVYTPAWTEAGKDGWNGEDFSLNDDKGRLRGMYRARPYVTEAPGTLLHMQWNETRKTLSVVYRPQVFPESLWIAIPSRLEWIDIRTAAGESSHDCSLDQPHQLLCIPKPGPRVAERSLLFIFRERPDSIQ